MEKELQSIANDIESKRQNNRDKLGREQQAILKRTQKELADIDKKIEKQEKLLRKGRPWVALTKDLVLVRKQTKKDNKEQISRLSKSVPAKSQLPNEYAVL